MIHFLIGYILSASQCHDQVFLFLLEAQDANVCIMVRLIFLGKLLHTYDEGMMVWHFVSISHKVTGTI
jgi:hypothetical protein